MVLSVPATELLTCPPTNPVAPGPILNLTVRFVALYSPWSSAKASVLLPEFGP